MHDSMSADALCWLNSRSSFSVVERIIALQIVTMSRQFTHVIVLPVVILAFGPTASMTSAARVLILASCFQGGV